MKKVKTNAAFCIAFSIIEFILFLLIQLTDGMLNRALSFSSVVLAFAFALITFIIEKGAFEIPLALLFTCFADFCLVILSPSPRVLAMVFFSCTQTVYALYLARREDGRRLALRHVYIRVLAVVALEIAMLAVLRDSADALSSITMYYFANLLMTFFISLKRKESLLFSIGILCFILCDVFVGLDVLISDYISVSEGSFL